MRNLILNYRFDESVRHSRYAFMCIVFLFSLIAASNVFANSGEDVPWKNDDVPPPNVILITLDTLRADRLSSYGYELNTSAQLEEFKETATFYPHAISTGAWTLPSHASIFTGLHSFEHGARVHKREKDGKIWTQLIRLNKNLPSLPGVFREAGYSTHGFVCNVVYLKEKWGFGNNFDQYEVIKYKTVASVELHKKLFPWLSEKKEKPFFLFLNYFDTHRNYNTTLRHDFLEHVAGKKCRGFLEACMHPVLSGEMDTTHPNLKLLSDMYDLAVTNQDEQLGKMFDHLKSLDLFDNSLIIVTADHGEYMGEHSLLEHGKDVYQDVVGIPFIIKYPGQKTAKVVEQTVSLVDVPWMILSELPVKYFKKYMDRFPYKPGNHPVITENYYSGNSGKSVYPVPKYMHRFDRVRTGVYQWPWKYIQSTDNKHELYNLTDDPLELKNLVNDQPEKARMLSVILEKFKMRGKKPPPVTGAGVPKLNKQELEEMKALGYL